MKSSATTPSVTVDAARPAPHRGRIASVAAFVCDETERLGREVGFPVAVVAATADPARHAAWLAATLYGACTPREGEGHAFPFGEGEVPPRDLRYRQLRFDPRWMGSARLPSGTSIDDGCLRVDLPRGTCVADLAAILRPGLAELSFDHVARRPDRVRHRHATRRPVSVGPRYALARPGDVGRVVACEDLFRFGPGDLATLASVVALGVDTLSLVAAAGRPSAWRTAREACQR